MIRDENHRDTSHRVVTTFCNVDTAYRAKTLNSVGKRHVWKKYATFYRNPGCSAKAILARG